MPRAAVLYPLSAPPASSWGHWHSWTTPRFCSRGPRSSGLAPIPFSWLTSSSAVSESPKWFETSCLSAGRSAEGGEQQEEDHRAARQPENGDDRHEPGERYESDGLPTEAVGERTGRIEHEHLGRE